MSVYRPDSDAPQVKKTSTEKAGGTQDYTSAGQGVVFEINRGSGRKDFPGRLERRQLIEFELMSSGWLKSEPLGVGSWGNLTGGSPTDDTICVVHGTVVRCACANGGGDARSKVLQQRAVCGYVARSFCADM